MVVTGATMVVARAAMVVALAAVIITVPAVVAAALAVIVVAAIVPMAIMITVAVIRGGQCHAAGGEQCGGNEQAADEFHHGVLRGRRGRNSTAIDFG